MSNTFLSQEKNGLWIHYDDPFFFVKNYLFAFIVVCGMWFVFWLSGALDKSPAEKQTYSDYEVVSTFGKTCEIYSEPDINSQVIGYSSQRNKLYKSYGGKWSLIENHQNEVGWVNCYLRHETK